MNARQVMRGLAAIVAIIAIIGGVPLLLTRLAGSPIPAHVPDWRHLGTILTQRDETGSLFVTLVRDLTWLAWLIFSVALITEFYAALRGRIAPRLHLGAVQSAAARLAALAALTFAAPTSLGLTWAAPAGAATALVANPAPAKVAPPAADGTRLTGDWQTVSSARQLRFVTVEPGECLWTLADRYLGDGDLYPQIADLNLGHRMDDGVVFSDPNIIYPGWRLELPADVLGGARAKSGQQPSPDQSRLRSEAGHRRYATSRHGGHATSYPRFRAPHPAASAPAVLPSPSRTPVAVPPPASRVGHEPRAEGHSGKELRHIADAAALALLAGGVLATLDALRRRQRSRRRPGRRIALPTDRAAQRAEQTLRAASAYYRNIPAPPPLNLRVALQELSAGLRAADRDLPECVGVHLVPDPPGLEILLAKPAGDPPAPFAVAPGQHAMAWQLDLTALWPEAWQSRPVQVGELMPGLFTVGTTTAGYLLLDLELMQVAVVRGQPAMVDRFITTAATELATNQWSGWYDLLAVGRFQELGLLDRVEQCDTMEDALRLLWLRKVSIDSRLGSAERPPGRTLVRSQRLVQPDDEDWALTVLVSRMPPTPEQFNDLLRLADRHGIAVLIPSPQGSDADAPASIDLTPSLLHPDSATATIRISALGDGHDIVVETATLDAADYEALGSLFAAAGREDIRPDEPPYQDMEPPPWLPAAASESAGPDSASADDAEPDTEEFERPPWLPPITAEVAAGHAAAAGQAGEAAADPAPEAAAEPTPGTRDSAARGPLRIAILGPAEITGTDAAVSAEQAELVLALALTAPERLSAPALATLLGTGPGRPMPLAAVRQLVTRTRRAIGLTPIGGYYIGHDADGYYLSEEAQLDWTEFTALARTGLESGDTEKLVAAMELVRGRPLDASRYWWIDAAMLETINAQVVDTALALAEARLAAGDAAGAAAAAQAGLRADPAAEQLSRVLMQAQHAAGNQDGLDAAWDDCHQAVHAADPVGRPQEETTDLYRALNVQGQNPSGAATSR